VSGPSSRTRGQPDERRSREDEDARHLPARLALRRHLPRCARRSPQALGGDAGRSARSEGDADGRCQAGEYRALSRVSFADYAREWIGTFRGRTSRGIRPETLADYRFDLERDAIPFFGRMQLAAVEPRDVKCFAVLLAERGLSASSVRNALAPVRALFATAFEEGLIRSNPAAGLRIAQRVAGEQERQSKALTEEGLRAFLDALPSEWRLFFEFLAHTGLRIGEAVALTWADVDLGKKRVHVRRRLYRGRFDAPKSRYGRRAVPLSAGIAQRLWRLRGAAPEQAPLFPSKIGSHLDPAKVFSRVLKPTARRAGVPWAGFHTLRHTCATMLFRHGLNAKQVQVWLGHHSPAFTLATYVHLIPDDLPDPTFLDTLTAQGGNEVATRAPEIGRDGEGRKSRERLSFPGETRAAEIAEAPF
jgi:integrase